MEWSIDKRLYFTMIPRGWNPVYRAMLANRVTTEFFEQFGAMTQEEAEAMAKLLNASQT